MVVHSDQMHSVPPSPTLSPLIERFLTVQLTALEHRLAATRAQASEYAAENAKLVQVTKESFSVFVCLRVCVCVCVCM